MKLIPLNDYVVLREIEQHRKTVGGIILPNSKQPPTQGVVLAVGPGRVTEKGTLIENLIKVGAQVVFDKDKVEEVKIDNEKYLIIRESDIFCEVSQ